MPYFKCWLNHCSRIKLCNCILFVLRGLKQPDQIYSCVEELASCVFVQNVESPALAITVPILLRGLRDKNTATKRLSCVIVDNMCQLIEHPKEILPFYGVLKKNLELLSETISDPEARKVSARALNTLKGSCSGSENISFMKTSEDFSKLIPANPENIK